MITRMLAAAAIATGALAGCGAQVDAKKESAPAKESSAPAAKSASKAAKSEAPKEDDGVAAFGERFRYKDGLVVTVTKPAKFKPSQYAAGHKRGNVGVLITVKIQNTSAEPFDAAIVQVDMKAGEDGNAASDVVDLGGSIELGTGFSGTIAAGRSATAKYGFSIRPADVGLINVEVTPDFEHEPSIFEGKL